VVESTAPASVLVRDRNTQFQTLVIMNQFFRHTKEIIAVPLKDAKEFEYRATIRDTCGCVYNQMDACRAQVSMCDAHKCMTAHVEILKGHETVITRIANQCTQCTSFLRVNQRSKDDPIVYLCPLHYLPPADIVKIKECITSAYKGGRLVTFGDFQKLFPAEEPAAQHNKL
jgi:hypothetical protein